VFNGRVGTGRHPGRVAYHQRCATGWEHVALHQIDLVLQAEAFQIFLCTVNGTLVLIRGDDLLDAVPDQQGGDDTSAGTNVEGELFARQGRVGDQLQVLAPYR